MANKKSKEREIAAQLYLNTEMTQKEISAKLKVTEKSVSDWAKEDNWKKIKDAKRTTDSETIGNLKKLLNKLSQENIEKQEKGEFSKNDADMLVEITTAIERLEDRIPLRVYVQVMEEFINLIPFEKVKLRSELAEYQILFLTDKAKA